MSNLKYVYRNNWQKSLSANLFFTITAIVLYIQYLEKRTCFSCIIFSLNFLLIAVLYFVYYKDKKNGFLILNHEMIKIPPIGLRKKVTEIPFSSIDFLEEIISGKEKVLLIKYNGKESLLASSLFENLSQYESAKKEVINKTNL